MSLRVRGREQIEIDTPNIAAGDPLRPGSYRIEVNDAGDATAVKIGQGRGGSQRPVDQHADVHDGQAVTFRRHRRSWWPTTPRARAPADEFDRWSMDRERARRSRGPLRARRNMSRPTSRATTISTSDGSWSSEPEYGYVWTPTRRECWAGPRIALGQLGVGLALGLELGRRFSVGLCAVPLRPLGACAQSLVLGSRSAPCARGVRARARGLGGFARHRYDCRGYRWAPAMSARPGHRFSRHYWGE